MAKKINVGGELNSTALEGKLVDALQVKDSSRGDKSQKEINDNLESNTGVSEYPTFDEAKAYAVGEVVLYEGLLKRFTSAHEPGAWDGSQVESWSEKKGLTKLGTQVIYDVSADGATFASLSELLSSENLSTLIPTAVRCGGMSIRFVQSSDNKYVQYMCKSSTWSSTPTAWEKVNNVSVSQNSQTGHTDITVGSSITPLPSIGDMEKINAYITVMCVNKINPYTLHIGEYFDGTSYTNNPEYDSTEKILIKPDTSYRSTRECRFVCLYKTNGTLSRVLQFVNSFTTNSDEDSVIITVTHTTSLKYCLKEGTEGKFVEYFAAKIGDGFITTPKIADASVTTPKIADAAVTIDKAGEGVAEHKVSKNRFNRNASDVKIGKYWTDSEGNNDSYNHTGKIAVEPNTTYCISRNNGSYRAPFVAYLATKTSTTSISCQNNKSVFTTPENCYYVIVTFHSSDWNGNIQIEQGSTRTSYEDYNDYRQIYLRNKQVTREKLADGIIVTPLFNRLTKKSALLSTQQSLKLNPTKISKGINITAVIDGSIGSVYVGLGYLGFYGRWIEITPTELIIHDSTQGTTVQTLLHGLTLGTQTKIVIDRYLSSATVTLFNDDGDMYRNTSVDWAGVIVGDVFARNNNQSESVGIELSLVPKDINEKIWLFGDSYFSYDYNGRWMFYMIKAGYTKNLINAMGGEASTTALSDFNTLLSLGAIPTYCVWALGMNNNSDTQDAPNATWLSDTQNFIAFCEKKDIIPILCTIPSVPNINHAQKNAWIRLSGYRYVDLAAAVEVEGTNTWKNWGTEKAMLASDEVHPTSYGAKALWGAFITQFPEIAIEL